MANITSFTFTTTDPQETVQEFIENQEILTVEDSYQMKENGVLEVTITDYWGDRPMELLVLQNTIRKEFA